MKRELLNVRGVSLKINKEYTYQDLNFSVFENELLGVCQLPYMKTISWMKQLVNPETRITGEVFYRGEKVDLNNPKISEEMYYISQESTLISSLSIADNLFALRKFSRNKLIYHKAIAEESVHAILEELHLPIDLNTSVGSLSKAMGHLLQIVKAVLLEARIIILDNITDDYNIREYEQLIRVINLLKCDGRAFVFFSNWENKLTEQADRIYIIRKLRLAGQIFHEEYSSTLFFNMLHGEKIMPMLSRKSTMREEVVFSSDFSGLINEDFQFSIHRGEVIGILDLYGSYCHKLVKYFMECFPYFIEQKRCKNYHQAVKNGLAMISFSECDSQLYQDFSLTENLTFQILPKISRGLIINKRIQKYCGNTYLKVIQEDRKSAGGLSDINLIMYKWLLSSPKLFVFDNLTMGMDSEAQKKFRHVVDQAAGKGSACIILTTASEDCLNLCDKIWVIQDENHCRMFDMNPELQTVDGMGEFKSYVSSYTPSFNRHI